MIFLFAHVGYLSSLEGRLIICFQTQPKTKSFEPTWRSPKSGNRFFSSNRGTSCPIIASPVQPTGPLCFFLSLLKFIVATKGQISINPFRNSFYCWLLANFLVANSFKKHGVDVILPKTSGKINHTPKILQPSRR